MRVRISRAGPLLAGVAQLAAAASLKGASWAFESPSRHQPLDIHANLGWLGWLRDDPGYGWGRPIHRAEARHWLNESGVAGMLRQPRWDFAPGGFSHHPTSTRSQGRIHTSPFRRTNDFRD